MADADPKLAMPAPIIVKRVTIVEGGHHGGAWKVAYADFVTAMMAFFLLLWLLGATQEKQRKGIADYFSPTLVKLRPEPAGAEGLLTGATIIDAKTPPGRPEPIERAVPTSPRAGVQESGQSAKDNEKLRALREKINRRIAEKRELSKFAKQVRVMRAPDGIRIDLMDNADFSMFELGTTILTKPARQLLQVMSETLKEENAPLIVRGHTDSLPWRGGVAANNWSLSTGRAEATRQALVLGGVAQTRVARIEGVADTEPLVADDPADPRNRRISLLLLERRGADSGRPVAETPPKAEGKAAP